jgi:hypothetical protein
MIQNAYVGLGSNLGDRAGYLLLAVRGMLDAGLDVIRLSSIYETEPVDMKSSRVSEHGRGVARLNASLARPSARATVANRICAWPHSRRGHGTAHHRSRSADLQGTPIRHGVSDTSSSANGSRVVSCLFRLASWCQISFIRCSANPSTNCWH